MVHDEDKTSLQEIPFVSRSPWYVSVLVLICVWVYPTLSSEVGPTHSPSPKTFGLEIGAVHPGDDLQLASTPVECITCQPQSADPLVFYQLVDTDGGQGGALSQVEFPGRFPENSSSVETMRRSIKLTEFQLGRGLCESSPPSWQGESISLRTNPVG
ncbi:MAG: hypothetical protein KDA84_25080 [Planctomycetaceae bacterium]|nr:hypothetical protein [Planctomycetaceae bacterium]